MRASLADLTTFIAVAPTSSLLEGQRHAVHAVAQASRARAIAKYVAEMTAAPAAMHLGSVHAETGVASLCHRVRQRLPKAGPAGMTIVLRIRRKNGQSAPRAAIEPRPCFKVELAREWDLRTLLAEHLIRRGTQHRAPLRISVRHGKRGGFRRLASWPEGKQAQPCQRDHSKQFAPIGHGNTSMGHSPGVFETPNGFVTALPTRLTRAGEAPDVARRCDAETQDTRLTRAGEASGAVAPRARLIASPSQKLPADEVADSCHDQDRDRIPVLLHSDYDSLSEGWG